MMLYTLLKILKIHIILSICMNILFFWTTHMYAIQTHKIHEENQPINQNEKSN